MTSPLPPPGPDLSNSLPTDPTLAPTTAITTHNASSRGANKAPSVIPLDDALKWRWGRPGIELLATNNPHAFLQGTFLCQMLQRPHLQAHHGLLVTLPVGWTLNVVRRGFLVNGQYDVSVTPVVLDLVVGREVEITEKMAGDIVEVLAEVYVEVYRKYESCATDSSTGFIEHETVQKQFPGARINRVDSASNAPQDITPELRPKWWKRMYYRITKTKTKPTDKILLNL
ncbi:hypothetical protein IFR05_013711 [Cadophora sp. M221]|nr:hypothetical protein IFR05_013711 [Cadophora sp. M221]